MWVSILSFNQDNFKRSYLKVLIVNFQQKKSWFKDVWQVESKFIFVKKIAHFFFKTIIWLSTRFAQSQWYYVEYALFNKINYEFKF